jgi:hypothetical protein
MPDQDADEAAREPSSNIADETPSPSKKSPHEFVRAVWRQTLQKQSEVRLEKAKTVLNRTIYIVETIGKLAIFVAIINYFAEGLSERIFGIIKLGSWTVLLSASHNCWLTVGRPATGGSPSPAPGPGGTG